MRLLPIVPLLLSIGALILAFLCLFAGSKPNFLENYSILTVRPQRWRKQVSQTKMLTSPLAQYLPHRPKPPKHNFLFLSQQPP